ncbi:MAG: glycosyltransferase family 2 protein [Anaerolineae bacterium]
MADLPLVSIITPSYNQVEFLEATILSVLNQDYPHIEYLVIDGGSTDGSADIIRRYEDRLAFWVSEPDRGQSHAINKGLRRATGDILSWLNSDDTLTAGAVRRAVTHLTGPNGVDVVYGRANRIDSRGNHVRSPGDSSPEFGLHTVIAECVVTQPGAFWRRKIMERVGLLNEELHYVMDYEFWARMALAGATFRRLDGAPVANFRLSEDSKTVSQLDKSGLEKLALLDRLLADPDLPRKLGLSPGEAARQARRARALACLKVFNACSRRKGQRADAWRWFVRGVRLYPPVLLEKWRLPLAVLRDTARR